jgi:hypothetical protein
MITLIKNYNYLPVFSLIDLVEFPTFAALSPRVKAQTSDSPTPTPMIPEFPTWAIVISLMAATISTALFVQLKKPNKSTSFNVKHEITQT